MCGYGGKAKGSHGSSKRNRIRAFKSGRKAAIDAGWEAFTPMTKKEHAAFMRAYRAKL
jgi:hypothetical protein